MRHASASPNVRERPFGTQWLRSRKVCSARRADFGVFGHLIPAVANERSRRHASANDEKCNANDCTDYSPAKWNANDYTADYSPAK
jgi:hypothetical protein